MSSTTLGSRDTISIRAAGRGHPLIKLRNGVDLAVEFRGERTLVRALQAGSVRPLALATGDFDEDLAPDLVASYAHSDRGIVTLQRGNVEAFAPQGPAAYEGYRRGRVPSSLLRSAQAFEVPEPVDLLAVGDFSQDGHKDVLAAARGGGLYLLQGDGEGGLETPQVVDLPGKVTALVTGEFNLLDGKPDVILGIAGPEGYAVLAYDGATREPVSYPLRGQATSLALGPLDDDGFVDLAVAAGNEVIIVHGQEEAMPGGMKRVDPLSHIEHISLPSAVRSLALGEFIWDRDGRAEMAVFSEDGSVRLLQRGKLDTRAYSELESGPRTPAARKLMLERIKAKANVPMWQPGDRQEWSIANRFDAAIPTVDAAPQALLVNSRISARAAEDLVLLDASKDRLRILIEDNPQGEVNSASYGNRVPVSLDVDGGPVAALALPQKFNGEREVVVLRAGSAEPSVIVVAMAMTFTVTTTDDTNDGTCDAHCSLREAVAAANLSSGPNTIEVPAGLGTYNLTLGSQLVIGSATNLNTTVMGTGGTAHINQTAAGVETLDAGPLPGTPVTVSLQNLKITGGKFGGVVGGNDNGTTRSNLTVNNCIIDSNTNSHATYGQGAGIFNSTGNLTVSHSEITNNNASNGSSGQGGGIFYNLPNAAGPTGVIGDLTIYHTRFTGNKANVGATFPAGAGIFVAVASVSNPLNISKCTFTNNQATGGGTGGAVASSSNGSLNVKFSRIVGNIAAAGSATGMAGQGSSPITAVDNWWGCNGDPLTGATGCDSAAGTGVTVSPRINLTHTANPATILRSQGGDQCTSTLTASFLVRSDSTAIAVANLDVLIGLPVTFQNPVLGSITGSQPVIQASGTATATFTAGTTGGNGSAEAKVDNQVTTAPITINQPPAITCPGNITVNTSPGVCTASVAFSTTATGFPAPTVVCKIGATTITSPHTFPKETTTVTCTASNGIHTDATCNNPGSAPDPTCSFTVTVEDKEPPSISCPSQITAGTDPGKCSAVVSYTALTVTDNCPDAVVSCSPPSGSTFAKGTTPVNCTATDASGTMSNCSFNVTVNDTQAPTVTCPGNITQSAGPSACSAVVTFSASANDNCDGPITPTCTPASGSTFAVGSTTVTCTATDSNGNTGSCSFNVTVNDNQLPTITSCPADIKVTESPPGSGSATVIFSTPAASDNCPGVSVSCSPASGTSFAVGTTTATCTATDANGNTASCSFKVTVEPACTITCSSDITVSNDPGQCGAVVNYPAPTTTGAGCGTVTCSPPAGSFFPVGTTPVTCTTQAGPSCSFNVTVVDSQAPTVTCPGDITQNAAAGQCSAVVTFTASAVDNCDGPITPTCTPASGSTFPVGTTAVTCTAIDAQGNTGSCSFNVKVVDTQPPSITCPANITKNADPGQCSAVVNYTTTASDNCPGVSVACSPPSGSTFPVGTTAVTCTATDASGNTASCSFNVTVVDNQVPAISGLSASPSSLWPPNHKLRDVTLSYSATDNCILTTCVLSVSSNEPENGTGDGDTAPDWIIVNPNLVRLRSERAGNGDGRVYTITVTCTDGAGNSTSSSTQVIVAHNITAPLSGSAFKVGTSVNFAGTFWDVPGNRHTAQWVFDNTITTRSSVTEPIGLRPGRVTGSYTFRDPGVYKVRLNITDQTGSTSYVTTNGDLEALVVIYDPNGGYVTGGGWAFSPRGALPSDPEATGKVGFGFTSKYFKNSPFPKGETLMEFLVGGLSFNALNLDYLVISGPRAQISGFGKVNEDAGFNFILTVIDGDLPGGGGTDRFRLKIWNKITGIIVYDNQLGASDAAAPVTPVGEGSTIKIKN